MSKDAKSQANYRKDTVRRRTLEARIDDRVVRTPEAAIASPETYAVTSKIISSEEKGETTEALRPIIPAVDIEAIAGLEPKPLDTSIHLPERSRGTLARTPHVPQLISVKPSARELDENVYLSPVGIIHATSAPIVRIPRLTIVSLSLRDMDDEAALYRPKREGAGELVVPRVPRIEVLEQTFKALELSSSLPDSALAAKNERAATSRHIAEARKAMTHITKISKKVNSLLSLLFDSQKGYGVKELLTVSPDRPVVIIAIKPPNDDYRGTLASILHELYRIKAGGIAAARYAGSTRDKFIVEEEHPGFTPIKVIDDAEASFLEFLALEKVEDFSKVDPRVLRSRLLEFNKQPLSFLVFYITEDRAKKLLLFMHSLRGELGRTKIVALRLRRVIAKNRRLKEFLARAAWGFVDPKEPPGKTLDNHFGERQRVFLSRLENLASRREVAEHVREGVEEGLGAESPLHYQLKAFVFLYLTRKLNIPVDDIETEARLSRDIVADVYIRSRRLAVEVETFYGTGQTPWRKLQRTIEKYHGCSKVDMVWIVVPPLQAILYLKELAEKAEELREEVSSPAVEIFTIDLDRKKLVPVTELAEKLKKRLFSRTVDR